MQLERGEVSMRELDVQAWQSAQVLNSYRGKGRLINTEDWYEGRLWQYRDGSIGFLCLIPEMEPEG